MDLDKLVTAVTEAGGLPENYVPAPMRVGV